MYEAYYPTKPVGWLAWIGCRDNDDSELRFRWGSVTLRWGLGIELCLFSEHGWNLKLHLLWPLIYIKVPWLKPYEPEEMLDEWGFSAHRHDAHFHWGSRTKVYSYPWARRYCGNERVLLVDGTWRPRKPVELNGDPYDSAHAPLPDVHVERHPYHYLLDDGEVQHTTAALMVTESESYWNNWSWVPFTRRRSRCIDFWFADEVGEEAGSWKGGVIGSAYQMRRGENPLQTLRRMQRERRF